MRNCADPRKVETISKDRPAKSLRNHYGLTIEDEVIESIFRACQDAVELYGPIRNSHMMHFYEKELQKNICFEMNMLKIEKKAVSKLDKE